MGNLKHYINCIRNGEAFFDEQFKFSFILHEVGIIHLIFAIMFLIMGNKFLGIYNVVAFVMYLILDTFVKMKKFKTVLFIASFEVLAHGLITAFLIGLNTGFTLYYFSMIPWVFYMVLAWNAFEKKIRISLIYTGLYMICMLAAYISTFVIEPAMRPEKGWALAFTIVNVVLSIVAMTEALILLDWDVMHKSEKMQNLNSELDEKANIDPLTKLYNRRYMNQKLEDLLVNLSKEGNIFGLIMGDIDNFKKVNDTYGHDFGDEVLKAVAAALKKSTRDDDVVCRWGGEEFLIAINGNRKITIDVAERMRTAVSEIRIPAGNDVISITMTFGVTESIPGFNADKLVGIADENLYKGKTSGKNKVVASPTFNLEVEDLIKP